MIKWKQKTKECNRAYKHYQGEDYLTESKDVK